MPIWTETTFYRYIFDVVPNDSKIKSGFFSNGSGSVLRMDPNYENLDEVLNDLSKICSENQFVIKSVLPLTNSFASQYAETKKNVTMSGNAGWGWGYGYGWGVTNIIGFVAMLEHQKEISQAEYDNRMKQINNNKISDELNNKLDILNKDIEKLETNINKGIETKKSLMGGKSYKFGNQDYKIEEEAKNALEGTKSLLREQQREKEELEAGLNNLQ